MGRSDAAFRRCWQEWVDNGIFQRHDGSSRPRATADQEDRLIVRSAVTALDSSLSTIRNMTRIRVSTMNIHRQPIEQNLRSYRPLRHLLFTPAHCRAILQWCLNRSVEFYSTKETYLPIFKNVGLTVHFDVERPLTSYNIPWSLVYADKPQTLDHLEDNIRRVIADIRPQMLEKVIENWTSRLDYIRASRGNHI
ncbi:HTH_Tnp_Tc3_2 domain-containing protein [Trichonephila clavipes]|nr:HTH_Tnp_Tc3_2 domain-containing protein [Trichonephila clavipes]